MSLYLGCTEVFIKLNPDWSAKGLNICESTQLISSKLTANLKTQVETKIYSGDQEQGSRRLIVEVSHDVGFFIFNSKSMDILQRHLLCLFEISVFVYIWMMEICLPTKVLLKPF